MEKKEKPVQRVLEFSKAIGFAVLGGLAAAGAIEVAQEPIFGPVLAAYPAFVSLVATVVSINSWDRVFNRGPDSVRNTEL